MSAQNSTQAVYGFLNDSLSVQDVVKLEKQIRDNTDFDVEISEETETGKVPIRLFSEG